MNILYKTTFNKPVKIPNTRTEEKDGKPVTITEEIDSTVPVNLVIPVPTRKQREEGSEFYSIELSNLISKGVLTREMLRKRILDVNGSFLTKDENKHYTDILKKRQNLTLEYQRIILIKEEDRTEDEKKSLEKIQEEYDVIQRNLQELEQLQESLFNQCAETLANNKALTWYITNLPQVEENGKTELIFKGETFEDKLNSYDEIVGKNDEFTNEMLTRCALVITMWRNGLANTQEEFDELIKKITAQ